ncbi:hypothetical protein SNE40_005207 [Patella caerulea]|uniref:Uncharacterized protein n=1 Tax=Patella caerulea TaxID=87958 RepID=A0AAN8K9H1_PATCE
MYPTSIQQNNPSELYPNSPQFQSELVLSHFSQYELVIKQFNILSIRDDVRTAIRNQVGSTISSSQHEVSILDRSKDDYKINPTSQFEFEQVIRANCEQMNIKGTIVLDGSFHDQQLLETGQYQIIKPKINGHHVDHCSMLNIRENNMVEYFDPLGNPPPKWIKDCCFNSKRLQNPSHNTCAIHCLCVLSLWHQGLTLSDVIEQYCGLPPDLNTDYYDDFVIDFYIRNIRSNYLPEA